jgi:hypothetical protein
MADRPTPPRRAPATLPPKVHDVPRVFKALPEGASIEQLLHAQHELGAAYATIAAAYTGQLPKLREDVDEVRFIQDAHGVRIGRLEIWREEMQTVAPPPLPPMREESASSHDLAKHVSQEVAEKVAAEIHNKSTPPPDKDKIAALSEEAIQVAVTRLKAQQWDAVEQQRKAAESDRLAVEKQAKLDRDALALENAKSRNKTKWALYLAGFLGVGTVAREVIEHLIIRAPAVAAPAPSAPATPPR